MTSIIEQADAIVGIWLPPSLPENPRGWMRRGAYVEHPNGFDLPRDIAGLAEAVALSVYLMRCLAPPVRRLLAAFEVVGEERDGAKALVVDGCQRAFLSAEKTKWVDQETICWLVPRGER